MFTRSITAAITLSILAAPVAALAKSERYEPVTVTIDVNGLNPTDPADRAKFDARLKIAARAACDTGAREMWARTAEQRCFDEVVTSGSHWGN